MFDACTNQIFFNIKVVFDRNRIFSLSADNDIDRNERADTKVWPKVNFLAISAERTDTTKRNCNNAP